MNTTEIPFKSVLIVDDDPILCSITQEFLSHHGVAPIHSAGDGREALAILDGAPEVDFIFIDLNMPKMDGLQFLRHLAERSFAGQIGIVSGEDRTVVKSAEILANRYGLAIRGTIAKPVDPDKIVALLAGPQRAGRDGEPGAAVGVTRSDLVFALVNRNIRPHFQPKVCAATGRLKGAEALARWQHPERGSIMPSAFIPAAENEGLIDALTGAVLRETFTALARWRTMSADMKIAANLSGDILSNPELPELLLNLVREAQVDPSHVVLEVTESRVFGDSAMPIEVLARLRMHRFELSIDDFGTGYSNIDRLREYPFTELKVDQSFIRNAGSDPFANRCVRASIDLGRALGLRLVAEGVETEEHYTYVKDLGIDEIQGFYFSRALSFEDFTAKYLAAAEVA